MSDVRPEELMAVLCARQIRDWERIGIGANSPIPAAGGLLASKLWARNVREAGVRGDAPMVGAKEFTNLAQSGKVDLFFFSAVQMDRSGNMNLQYVLRPDGSRRRFQGAFAAPVYYYCAKRTVICRTEHSPRFLVEQVDYITASARAHPRASRLGTLATVITPMAVLDFNATAQRLELSSVHQNYTVEDVQAATGFPLALAEHFDVTKPPTEEELRVLRTQVFDELRLLYPHFVERMSVDEVACK